MRNLRHGEVRHSNRTEQVLPWLNLNDDYRPELCVPHRQCSSSIWTVINRSRVGEIHHSLGD